MTGRSRTALFAPVDSLVYATHGKETSRIPEIIQAIVGLCGFQLTEVALNALTGMCPVLREVSALEHVM